MRLRDEAVQGGAAARKPLRPIDTQMPRLLVELVLDAIGRDDLDEGIHQIRSADLGRNAVPRVRLEQTREQLLGVFGDDTHDDRWS
jgi:hypothetical protein